MGIRFDLGSANVVSYLTSRRPEGVRLTVAAVEAFLYRLAEDSDLARPRIISSSPEWVAQMRAQAREALDTLNQSVDRWGDTVIPPDLLRRILDPLAVVLGQYDVYVMPVGLWRDAEVLDRFAMEAAHLPGRGILVLIPDYYDGAGNVRLLDPAEGAAEALKNRDAWPGAIFALRTGESTFLPLEDARESLYRLMEASADYGAGSRSRDFLDQAREVLTEARAAQEFSLRRRILHLSDLHLGTRRTAETQVYLQSNLVSKFDSIDHVVVTGDLFDQPRSRHAQQFRNFRDQIQLLSGKRPIVVPGNHDQRIFGNTFFGLGRSLAQLAELDWRPFVIDDATELVFFCFDSSRSQDLARGTVDTKQLLQMATASDVHNKKGQHANYLKLALVHHHPYPYQEDREVPIVDPRGWVGREEFIEFIGAKEFLSWCAGRGVGLILHGHKHIPRLVEDEVEYGDPHNPSYRRITTVGCGTSLGANGKALSFNVIEWSPQSQSWTVDFQIDRGDGQGFRSATVESSGLPSY